MSILQAVAIAIVPVALLSTVVYAGNHRLAMMPDSYELAAQ